MMCAKYPFGADRHLRAFRFSVDIEPSSCELVVRPQAHPVMGASVALNWAGDCRTVRGGAQISRRLDRTGAMSHSVKVRRSWLIGRLMIHQPSGPLSTHSPSTSIAHTSEGVLAMFRKKVVSSGSSQTNTLPGCS